jgi:lysozyme
MTALDIATPLITTFEGVRLTAYQDTGGVWTIGVGETGPEVKQGLTITYEQAMGMLTVRLHTLYLMVISKPPVVGAAYISFGYNCGAGALSRVLNGVDTISNPKYTRDMRGNTLPGLANRRALELALIQSA